MPIHSALADIPSRSHRPMSLLLFMLLSSQLTGCSSLINSFFSERTPAQLYPCPEKPATPWSLSHEAKNGYALQLENGKVFNFFIGKIGTTTSKTTLEIYTHEIYTGPDTATQEKLLYNPKEAKLVVNGVATSFSGRISSETRRDECRWLHTTLIDLTRCSATLHFPVAIQAHNQEIFIYPGTLSIDNNKKLTFPPIRYCYEPGGIINHWGR